MAARGRVKSRNYPPPRVEGARSEHFPPGAAAAPPDYQPGDFLLTHATGFASSLIRFGQTLRFVGKNRRYAWWSHAALVVASDGALIEARGNGVQRSHISKYAETDYQLVKLGTLASEADRVQIARYAEWALGQEYGWMTIVSISLSLLTGGALTFGFDGQSICSGLVARALERSDAIFDRSPSHIMPADLAKYFHVQRPPKGASKGRIPRAASGEAAPSRAAAPPA